MKKILLVFFILILILGAFFTPYVLEFSDVVVSNDNSEVVIEIPKGMSSKEIGALLREKECIKSEYTFYLKLRYSEYLGKLNYGEFKLRKNMSLTEIIESIFTLYTFFFSQ